MHVQRLLAPARARTGASHVNGPATLQRLTILAPGAGMGHKQNDSGDDSLIRLDARAAYAVNDRDVAAADFGDGQSASIALNPGTQGTLRILLRAHAQVDNAFPVENVEYDRDYLVEWPVSVAPDGKVTVSDAAPIKYPEGEPTFQLYLSSLEATQAASYVQVRATIVSATSRGDTNTISPIGLGVEKSYGVAGRTWIRDFRLSIPGLEPRPAPQATVRVAAERDVLFGVGADSLEGGQADQLVEWYGALPEAVREAVRTGKGSIQLDGYASSTGGSAANVDLAERRNQAVMKRLRAQAGGERAFQDPPPATHGEEPARRASGDRKEVPEWRRVHVKVLVREGAR
jgi:outer membrane protein OmpA-like peptidoglycan-associated protein